MLKMSELTCTALCCIDAGMPEQQKADLTKLTKQAGLRQTKRSMKRGIVYMIVKTKYKKVVSRAISKP
jgi:hypothetical protein